MALFIEIFGDPSVAVVETRQCCVCHKIEERYIHYDQWFQEKLTIGRCNRMCFQTRPIKISCRYTGQYSCLNSPPLDPSVVKLRRNLYFRNQIDLWYWNRVSKWNPELIKKRWELLKTQ